MSQTVEPRLLDISIEYDDDPSLLGCAPDPRTWLGKLVEDTEYIFANWEELKREYGSSYIQPALPAVRNARLNGNSALQALSDGDINEAMAAAFRAGMWCDRAKTIVPIFSSLRRRKQSSSKANKKSVQIRAEKASNLRDKVEAYAKELLEEGLEQIDLCSTIERKLKLKDEISRTTTQIRNDLKTLGIWIEKVKK
jgi:hypothetical protein